MTPITELTGLDGAKALLKEWLAGYFNAASHTVGTAPADFPAAVIEMDQGAGESAGLGIRLIVGGSGTRKHWYTGSHWLQTEAVRGEAWIRAKSAEGDDAANTLVNTGARLLCALIRSPVATLPLAENGLMNLRLRSHVTVESKLHATRYVTFTGLMQFEISGVPTT